MRSDLSQELGSSGNHSQCGWECQGKVPSPRNESLEPFCYSIHAYTFACRIKKAYISQTQSHALKG